MTARVPGVLSLTLAFVCACDATMPAPDGDHGDINGADDRLDLAEVDNATLREMARSTVLLTDTSTVQAVGDRRAFTTRTLQDKQGLCADEPFAAQPTVGFCSGSLIAPDLVLTAGHCFDSDPGVTPDQKCETTTFVFGYAYEREADIGKAITVPGSDVYRCARVERFQQHETEDGDVVDYAILRLDRPVADRDPLGAKLRRTGAVDPDQKLTVIGNPEGLPTKLAGGGRVVADAGDNLFDATLDAFGGNSGSIVVTSRGRIEGILVSGGTDYERDDARGCQVAVRCKKISDDDERCIGSQVLRTAVFLDDVDAEL